MKTRWKKLFEVPRRRRQPGLKRRGIYLLPNLLTTGALCAGFYTIIAAINGAFEAAALATLAAMVLDFADGRVARYTHTESEFGAEYDSLSDMVSFGVAPGLMAFMYAVSNLGRWGWVIIFIYVACTALRLARFNASASSDYFTGLASPAGAGLVASSVWLLEHFSGPGRSDSIALGIVLAVVVLVAGFLMGSNIAYVSPKAVKLGSRVPFTVLVGAALIFAIVLLDPPSVLLAIFAAYAASGPLQFVLSRRGGRHERKQAPVEPRVSQSGSKDAGDAHEDAKKGTAHGEGGNRLDSA